MRRTRLSLMLAVLCCHCALAPARAQTGEVRFEPAGELRRQAFLGVALGSPSADRAGAEVRRVVDAGAAAKAGLRQGDRILRVNGTLLDSPVALQRALVSLRGGDGATRPRSSPCRANN
jgi:S1-C subfamily serine protease